jgi:hypothetical protein
MSGNISGFIRARIAEERDRKRNVGFLPFRSAVLSALETIAAEHADAGPGVTYVHGEQHRSRHVCRVCGTKDEYAVAWPCSTVKEVAAVWASHPDHVDTWKTTTGVEE